jgi:hypothetical protein
MRLRLNGRAVKGQVTAGLLTIGNYGGYIFGNGSMVN